jgi:hypothetical protein
LEKTHQQGFFDAISGVLIAYRTLGFMGIGFDSTAYQIIARGAIHLKVGIGVGVLLFCQFHDSLYRRIFGDGKSVVGSGRDSNPPLWFSVSGLGLRFYCLPCYQIDATLIPFPRQASVFIPRQTVLDSVAIMGGIL